MADGKEFYYLDRDGKRRDASLHAEILNNKKARKADRDDAVRRAVAEGLSAEEALLLYRENVDDSI